MILKEKLRMYHIAAIFVLNEPKAKSYHSQGLVNWKTFTENL